VYGPALAAEPSSTAAKAPVAVWAAIGENRGPLTQELVAGWLAQPAASAKAMTANKRMKISPISASLVCNWVCVSSSRRCKQVFSHILRERVDSSAL